MATTWIVAADASRARVLQVAGRERLDEVENLLNPEGRHRSDQLVLVAPPKFLGALRKELGKEVGKLVADEIPKDLSWFNERELEEYFSKGSGRAP